MKTKCPLLFISLFVLWVGNSADEDECSLTDRKCCTITSRNTTKTEEEGTNLTLSCTTNCRIEIDDSLDWYHKHEIYAISGGVPRGLTGFNKTKHIVNYCTENENYVNVSLTIINLNENDRGNYSCTLITSNSENKNKKTSTATWTVDVKPKDLKNKEKQQQRTTAPPTTNQPTEGGSTCYCLDLFQGPCLVLVIILGILVAAAAGIIGYTVRNTRTTTLPTIQTTQTADDEEDQEEHDDPLKFVKKKLLRNRHSPRSSESSTSERLNLTTKY